MYTSKLKYLLKAVEEFSLTITPYSTLITVIPMFSKTSHVTENMQNVE